MSTRHIRFYACTMTMIHTRCSTAVRLPRSSTTLLVSQRQNKHPPMERTVVWMPPPRQSLPDRFHNEMPILKTQSRTDRLKNDRDLKTQEHTRTKSLRRRVDRARNLAYLSGSTPRLFGGRGRAQYLTRERCSTTRALRSRMTSFWWAQSRNYERVHILKGSHLAAQLGIKRNGQEETNQLLSLKTSGCPPTNVRKRMPKTILRDKLLRKEALLEVQLG